MSIMEDSGLIMIDEAYEFLAPRFFDFIEGETEDEMLNAQLWFETTLSHAPSPFMPKIKTSRTVQLESLCDFSEGETILVAPEESDLETEKPEQSRLQPNNTTEETKVTAKETKEEHNSCLPNLLSVDEKTHEVKKEIISSAQENESDSTAHVIINQLTVEKNASLVTEAFTPKPPMASQKKQLRTDSKKQLTARKIASAVTNPSALKARNQSQVSNVKSIKPASVRLDANLASTIASAVTNPSALKARNQSQLSNVKSIKPASVRRDANLASKIGTPSLVQENQAIKRQKLEGGQSRQILSIRPKTFPHKSRTIGVNGTSNATPSSAKYRKEDRKMYVREPAAAPFVSMAEMMQKFHSNTRGMNLPSINSSRSHADAETIVKRKPKLTLTRPKEPDFETAQRVRSVKIKSSAELEEEMMAKIPKFKARPVNKKILEAPTLPALQRSTPQPPEFQEFHLETMARANQNAETSTVASTESSAPQNNQWKPHLTAPKTPLLQTSLRARPPRIKSSEEQEKEELEKAPKFKARPLNKKIFESKGELGVFCNTKRQVTVPQEFHFATDDRIPPPALSVADLFDKLSLCSESSHREQKLPRNTAPNPFHLHTEERGAEKEKKFVTEVVQKQLEEERARIPKANPYPYTTDYPVLPPKPEPKQCTKPEPFQLESLVRHEEEMQREMEERRRIEEEESRLRIFRAQPILKEDPIPVPEKVRRPLTEVQEVDLHVEHRAVDRAEFDKKIKEKETMYKRYRDEAESAKLIEEEKALKQLRRTLVPHARPVPNFDRPLLPQKSSQRITKPRSPRLNIVGRKERRKMFYPAAAASSPASGMR